MAEKTQKNTLSILIVYGNHAKTGTTYSQLVSNSILLIIHRNSLNTRQRRKINNRKRIVRDKP